MIDLSGATPRQRDFITDLLATREFVAAESTVIATPAQASLLIDRLMAAPRKAVTLRATVDTELNDALNSVPLAKYALPTSELMQELFDVRLHGDLLFVEVKEWKGRRYFNRLSGAPGSFSRSRMSRKDTLMLLAIIAADAYRYTRLFGEHYRCCGRCGAELTDERSRELMLGPTCRTAFGF